MATYSVGDKTKMKIENTARELFYLHGYDNTTYAQVSKQANVNLGTIVYHYKSLDNLADIIYKDTVRNRSIVFNNKVAEEFGSNCFNDTIKNFAQYRVNVQSYIDYPNYSRFVMQRLSKANSWDSNAFDISTIALCNDYKLSVSKEDCTLQKYLFMPYGSFVANAINQGLISMSAKQVCDYQLKIKLLAFNVPEDVIASILGDVDTIANKIILKVDPLLHVY